MHVDVTLYGQSDQTLGLQEHAAGYRNIYLQDIQTLAFEMKHMFILSTVSERWVQENEQEVQRVSDRIYLMYNSTKNELKK